MEQRTKLILNYAELPSTDLAETKRFYEEAFGWQFTDYGPEYAAFEEGAPMSGGFYLADEVRSGGALLVVQAHDLEAALAAVERAGGTIVRDIFSFPGGRRFHFTDPSGNELAVWSEV